MNREAINYLMDYCETHEAAVQVTLYDGQYIADFKSDNMARDCSTNMIAAGYDVIHNPNVDGIRYYARLV